MITSNIKRKVLQSAHKLIKGNICTSMSEAMRKAWHLVKLENGLIYTVSFAKKTGELREATVKYLSLKTISEGYVKFLETAEGLDQWRSFTIQNMVA